jgi:hypothetical protein
MIMPSKTNSNLQKYFVSCSITITCFFIAGLLHHHYASIFMAYLAKHVAHANGLVADMSAPAIHLALLIRCQLAASRLHAPYSA